MDEASEGRAKVYLQTKLTPGKTKFVTLLLKLLINIILRGMILIMDTVIDNFSTAFNFKVSRISGIQKLFHYFFKAFCLTADFQN